MTTKHIGVFTGSRSEYGLLVPVMRAIAAHDDLVLHVMSGDPDPGQPEFPLAAHVPITRADETPGSTPRAIGQGVLDLSDALDHLALDALVIYGDRFEAFAAMIAATQRGLAVAHIEGGDLTQGGTLDDVVRHAMSKLAHLHFPTNEDAADRLRAMGEEDWRITTAGFPPIDLIEAGDYASPEEVTEALRLDPTRPILLFTQHPISTDPQASATDIARCMAALACFTETTQIVLTHPNGDVGSEAIIDALAAFQTAHPATILRPTLGRRLYHGVLNMIGNGQGACIGNSSSGLKETPAFRCPAVDIGPRQAGRLRGANVLHVESDTDAIAKAIRTALSDESLLETVRSAANPYGKGNSGPTIARILATTDLKDTKLIQKQTIL